MVAALMVAPLVGATVFVVSAMMPPPVVVSAVVVSRVMRPVPLTVVPAMLRVVVAVVALLLVGARAVPLSRRGGRHQQRRDDQQRYGDDPHPHPPQRASSRTSGATHGHEPTSAPDRPADLHKLLATAGV